MSTSIPNPATQPVKCKCGQVAGTHRVEAIDKERMLFQGVWNLTGSWYIEHRGSVPRCIDCKGMILTR